MTTPRVVIQAETEGERAALKGLLAGLSCEVTETGRVEEVASLILKTAPVLTFCQTDPGSALRLLDEARDAAIVVIGTSTDVTLAVSCIRKGAVDYLAAPAEEDRVKKIAERFLVPVITEGGPRSIVTRDAGMQRTISLASRVAASRAPVFIQGESGTGKELFARYVHDHSDRARGAFVAVNCAALPETLLESELFGHEKGAFTGAAAKKAGKFEQADGGTLLLDEITEMPVHLQAKLLRVLQEGEVDRVGGSRPVSIDVRIIATTNRDLKTAMDDGIFREDLYHRLNTIPLKIPPLRNRKADILILARHFIDKYNRIDGRSVRELTEGAVKRLESFAFSGNVRELENLIRRAVLLSDGIRIRPEDLLVEEDVARMAEEPAAAPAMPSDFVDMPLKEIEKQVILSTLQRTDGNRTHAAQMLGISVRTLRNKLNEYRGDTPIP